MSTTAMVQCSSFSWPAKHSPVIRKPRAGRIVGIKSNSTSSWPGSIQIKANNQDLVYDGLVFKQNFLIHSYDIGPDRKATIEMLMNLLQETAFNHHSGGKINDGFSTTPEMSIRNLTWVIIKMQLQVERYPSWGDNVQVDTWCSACGERRLRRDWHVHDPRTKQTFMKATSVWMAMNKKTRKLSKIPEEVRVGLHVCNRALLLDEDNRKLQKLSDQTAHYVKRGICPVWKDFDINQHVNNVKYISWILESAPMWMHGSHDLCGMRLEYRRECGRDNMLESLVSFSNGHSNICPETTKIECEHMLRLEDGVELVRARSQWMPKSAQKH